jgi:hypothetical protein
MCKLLDCKAKFSPVKSRAAPLELPRQAFFLEVA